MKPENGITPMTLQRIERTIATRIATWLLTAAASFAAVAQDTGVRVQTDDTAVEVIEVIAGRSATLESDWRVERVAVTDPKIADVQVLTSLQVMVQGKSVGTTDVILWGEQDQAWRARVMVNADLSRLRHETAELFPGSALSFRQVNDSVIVSGLFRRAEHAAQLENLMESLGFPFVNMTSIAGVQQVMLQVRIAEASRTAIRSLGVNFFHAGEDFFLGNTLGPSNAGAINPIPLGVLEEAPIGEGLPFNFVDEVTVSPGVTLFGGVPDAELQVFLQALAENQYLRILAEPNLVALSGEEATFLAGGEFPIPVVQGGVGESTAITIEYREFGVRLNFKPVVLGDGAIHLYVAPEVSELSDVGAVEIQGFRIPGTLTRRATTTVQLNTGQTFAMAGLLNQSTTARNSSVPGLGRLPILGPLFRSVRYESGETELVVLVTAHLVEPLSITEDRPLPGMMHVPPTDWDLYMNGNIEAGQLPNVSPIDSAWMEDLGLDQLKGPGTWIRHENLGKHQQRAVYRAGSSSGDGVSAEPANPVP